MEDILFLGLCFGTPVLMVLALLWLALGALREWWSIRSLGWDEANSDDVATLLRSAPTLGGCVFLRPRRQADNVAVTARKKVRGGNRGQTAHTPTPLLIWPHAGVGTGLIARRTGGLLERAVERFAPAVDAPESWSWARIHGPVDPDWLTDARGRALEKVLDTQLYLLDDNVALTGYRQGRLMREATERRAVVDNALTQTD